MRMHHPLGRSYAMWQPCVSEPDAGPLHRGGLRVAVSLSGPAGPVTQPGTDLGYNGMDPSDPQTWTRIYNPAPGMIARLNFDGAMPAQTQTIGRRPGRRRG